MSRRLVAERELGDEARPAARVDVQRAAKGFHPVDEVAQTVAGGGVGEARPVSAVAVVPSDRSTTVTRVARACLSTLASASEHTKYAAASTAAGNRRSSMSICTGVRHRATSPARAARRPDSARDRG